MWSLPMFKEIDLFFRSHWLQYESTLPMVMFLQMFWYYYLFLLTWLHDISCLFKDDHSQHWESGDWHTLRSWKSHFSLHFSTCFYPLYPGCPTYGPWARSSLQNCSMWPTVVWQTTRSWGAGLVGCGLLQNLDSLGPVRHGWWRQGGEQGLHLHPNPTVGLRPTPLPSPAHFYSCYWPADPA